MVLEGIGLRLLHAPACAAAAGQPSADLLKTIVSLRHFGIAAVGILEHAAGGGVRQSRSYRPAQAQPYERPNHTPRPYTGPGARSGGAGLFS